MPGPCFNKIDFLKAVLITSYNVLEAVIFPTTILASGPVHGPFSCMTADPMKKEKRSCLEEQHVFYFLTLAAQGSAGLFWSHHGANLSPPL